MSAPHDLRSDNAAGIAILLWACEPEAPHRLATPFFHAATPLIPECTRRGGAVQFMARAADLRWRTMVF